MQVNDTHRSRRENLILAAICFVLQLALAPYLSLGTAHINFALVFCGLVALSQGGSTAVISGFLAGLIFDLCSTGPIGLMSMLLSLAGFVLGIERRNRLAEDFAPSLIQFAIIDIVLQLLYLIFMLITGHNANFFASILTVALPSAFLSFIVFFIFAWLLHRHNGGGSSSRARGLSTKYSLK